MPNGGDTDTLDDASPVISGLLTAPLKAGEVVQVYDGATHLGEATVSGITWTYQPTTPLALGDHSLSAKVLQHGQRQRGCLQQRLHNLRAGSYANSSHYDGNRTTRRAMEYSGEQYEHEGRHPHNLRHCFRSEQRRCTRGSMTPLMV